MNKKITFKDILVLLLIILCTYMYVLSVQSDKANVEIITDYRNKVDSLRNELIVSYKYADSLRTTNKQLLSDISSRKDDLDSLNQEYDAKIKELEDIKTDDELQEIFNNDYNID